LQIHYAAFGGSKDSLRRAVLFLRLSAKKELLTSQNFIGGEAAVLFMQKLSKNQINLHFRTVS
jgi:hypothetical protein